MTVKVQSHQLEKMYWPRGSDALNWLVALWNSVSYACYPVCKISKNICENFAEKFFNNFLKKFTWN